MKKIHETPSTKDHINYVENQKYLPIENLQKIEGAGLKVVDHS